MKQPGRMGADRAVNGKTGDMAAELSDFTGGFGADVVVEAVGMPRLLEESLGYAALGVASLSWGSTPNRRRSPRSW